MSSSRKLQANQKVQRDSLKSGVTATSQYIENDSTEPSTSRSTTASLPPALVGGVSPRRNAAQVAGMNGYNASTDLPPPLFVRALYNYEADDQTSLSFRQGDIIQVITQLESGWWDGVINDVRGWFPSNYCAAINPDDSSSASQDESETSAESGTEEEYEDDDDESDSHTQDEDSDLPIEGTAPPPPEEAAFWVPQATPDGRLFYFNTLTGVSTMELPLEAPTSADETGPRDRNNFFVPLQTRAPAEMMNGSGYQSRDEDYDGSASEADGEQSFLSLGRNGLTSLSTSSSANSTNVDLTASRRQDNQSKQIPNLSVSHSDLSMAPLGTAATSFAVSPPGPTLRSPTAPKFFSDDGFLAPLTWKTLVSNMQMSVEAYRQAIRNEDRAEYVRRAEDISDHLRALLAAGSGTTDNHSGNPSIISTNRALYPHFREMMSKFSKLVLSSHIAAADFPGPDALSKCLQEAEGVLNGVYGYVEVARQQRGDEIPRLVPGFVQGSKLAGNWRDNNIELHSGESAPFMENHDVRSRPSAVLDSQLLRRIDDSKKMLITILRKLEDQLQISDKIVSPARQTAIGDNVCRGAGAVIEQFRPWINQVESIDLSSLGNVFQKPSLSDFGSHKQKVYDSIGELVATCQAVTAPLSDEWSEMRGESLETRLNNVRNACKQLENHVSHVGYALQLQLPTAGLQTSTDGKPDHRMTVGGETLQNNHLRSDSSQRPLLGEIGQSRSYTIGEQPPLDRSRRQPSKDKRQQFFGTVPPPVKNSPTDPGSPTEETPWFLQLDHSREITYDTKAEPPQVKAGTLTGLVEQLTRHDRPDTTFNTIFLLTYRSFTSAAELFELLVQRFNVQPPGGLTREEFQSWEEHKQKPVRFRVVNTLKIWLEQYWMESNDAESQNLLERVLAFTKTTISSTKIPGAAQIVTIIEQRKKGQDPSAKRLVLTLTNSAPAPILPKNMKKFKFLDIDTTEFARQLTIIESKLYGKIKPVECLDKTWQKKDKTEGSEPAPNVKALILHSNQLTNWVAEMILSYPEVKKRVVVIKQFVAIADKCRSLNNFSTLTAIISALGTAPILRLNRTWTQVNPKTVGLLESMRTLIASTKNFGQYREALHAANPPCIPFLGVYLTDLTFIEDGIASVVKNSELINFTKRTKTAEVIRDIQHYQNSPYALNPVAELQEWILDNMRAAGDVHEMYNRSLVIEPREREEEKIARLLSESGFL